METEIQPPIPRAQVWLQIGAGASLGLLLALSRARVLAWLARRFGPWGPLFGAAALQLAVAVFLGWYGYRILASRRFPPPGAWVWRPTPVHRGRAAGLRGWFHLAGAAVLATLSLALATVPARYSAPAHPAPRGPR